MTVRGWLVAALFTGMFWVASGSAEETATLRMTPMVRAIRRTRPAVVNIQSQKQSPADANSAASRMQGMGSGVIVDERGFIVTNYHVIEDVQSIRVSLIDGTTCPAQIIGRDQETDIALIKIESRDSLTVMPMGNSEDLMHGETVIVIGNPFGYEHSVSSGIISELHRHVKLSAEQSYHDLIQTDAPINPGNSGGPLINIDGQMIGLNVAIRAGAQGIAFAIPVDQIKEVVAKLMSNRSQSRIKHGLVCAPASVHDQSPGRLIVRSVTPNSPAARAGLQPGDRLLSMGPYRVSALFDIERALLGRGLGDNIPLAFVRSGKENRAQLRLAEVSGAAAASNAGDPWDLRLGLVMTEEPSDGEIRKVSNLRGGLRIMEVKTGGWGARAQLRPGDILIGIHEFYTVHRDDIRFILDHAEVRDLPRVKFYILRDGQVHKGEFVVR